VNNANNTRLIVTKAILWMLVGIACAVALARYVRGLGATTALTDGTPWGLWIGFDVLSGVALAAGGFVIAATVYIFHLDRYHGLVRPAVLTAFLGYFAVALGLLVDLGRPWNIWRMIIFWQPDSPLFEVGWCVMLYLTVLALEFVPVIFEGFKWQRAVGVMRRVSLVFVIAGIGLSTLHQSSLGTLFLLAEDRLHPLWYSPILPLLFFISAIGLGLMMVAVESSSTAWLYHRKGEGPVLRGLVRAASVVLVLYLAVRIFDLGFRHQLHHLLEPSWYSVLFVVEIAMSVVIPLFLFNLPSLSEKTWPLVVGAFSGVGGFVLHRADVGGIVHMATTGETYVPALTEILVSVGLVSAMALIFLFFVERFPVWEEAPPVPDHFTEPMADPMTRAYFGGLWFGRTHLAAAAWVIGVIAGMVVLETTTAEGQYPPSVPTTSARAVGAVRLAVDEGMPASLIFLGNESIPTELPEGFTTALLIDGDGAGRAVLFDHAAHRDRLGGEASCGRCHHRNYRFERGTPCANCHADMYRCTDTFGHEEHVLALGENASCDRCHPTAENVATRAEAKPCIDCHQSDIVESFAAKQHRRASSNALGDIECEGCHSALAASDGGGVVDPRSVQGIAPGYRLAMHQLCVECHSEHEAKAAVEEPTMTRCGFCHRGVEAEIAAPPMPSIGETPVVVAGGIAQ
jgi:Ni/Fe-hydrogenase subunit HybB-like protein